MRKLFTFFATVLLTGSVFLPQQAGAQSPEKMSYQAIIRNSNNELVKSATVGMRISILQGSASGTAVYTETQTPTTNANGLVSIEIGGGTGFSTINWSAGPYFIETKTDIAGGTNYTITGTSQLLSVPFALHAKTADNGITTAQTTKLAGIAEGAEVNVNADWNATSGDAQILNKPTNDFYLGQDTLGGIVFYIYLDAKGDQRGLIVSKTETTATWSDSATLVGANKTSNGAFNTTLMPKGAGTARAWVETLGAGWYLPSIDELSILWHNRFHVNNSSASGLTLLSEGDYWSSTEYNAAYASFFYFHYCRTNHGGKHDAIMVRAVRAF